MDNRRDPVSIYEMKAHWTWHPIALVVGIGLMALSVILLANPKSTLSTIALVLGIVLTLRSLVMLFTATKSLGADETTRATVGYIVGGLLLILGIVLMLRQSFIMDALFLIAAIILILDTLTNLFLLPRLARHNGALALVAALANVLTLASAVMLLVEPEWAWYSHSLGLGIAILTWGLSYLMFGVAAAGWMGRHEPVRRIERSPENDADTATREASDDR